MCDFLIPIYNFIAHFIFIWLWIICATSTGYWVNRKNNASFLMIIFIIAIGWIILFPFLLGHYLGKKFENIN